MTLQLPTFTQGDRMAKLRKDARVSRQKMADRLVVTPGTISNWEHDRNPPPRSAVLYYAELREDIDRNLMVQWIETGRVDLCDLPKNDFPWNPSYESQDPLPFDDLDELIIDLRDNRHEVYTRREPDTSYALAG